MKKNATTAVKPVISNEIVLKSRVIMVIVDQLRYVIVATKKVIFLVIVLTAVARRMSHVTSVTKWVILLRNAPIKTTSRRAILAIRRAILLVIAPRALRPRTETYRHMDKHILSSTLSKRFIIWHVRCCTVTCLTLFPCLRAAI